MTNPQITIDGLTYRAEFIDDTWTIVGESGERWWPHPEQVVETAEDALRLCADDPMAGSWQD